MTSPAHTERLLPALVYIQTYLAEDLSLERMAQVAGISPFHFHRIFRETIGETLKQYTLRLRLERAAHELRIRQAPILEIALGSGFQSHEVFSRAFKRQFGVTPRSFRRNGRGQDATSIVPNPAPHLLNRYTTQYQLSKVRVQKFNSIPVAFIRHLGPYVDVDVGLFDTLITWARQRGVYTGDNLLIGIGQDAPDITPPEKLRFDACISVPAPIEAAGEVGYQCTPAGHYGVASYIGPFGPTLVDAYTIIFQQLAKLKRFEVIGLPVIEIYRTTHINPNYDLNQTDIFIPVEKVF